MTPLSSTAIRCGYRRNGEARSRAERPPEAAERVTLTAATDTGVEKPPTCVAGQKTDWSLSASGPPSLLPSSHQNPAAAAADEAEPSQPRKEGAKRRSGDAVQRAPSANPVPEVGQAPDSSHVLRSGLLCEGLTADRAQHAAGVQQAAGPERSPGEGGWVPEGGGAELPLPGRPGAASAAVERRPRKNWATKALLPALMNTTPEPAQSTAPEYTLPQGQLV